MRLHEITEQHRQLEHLVEDGEFTIDDLADTFEGIEGQFNDKAVSLIHVVNNMESDIQAISEELKRLQARKKAIEARKESLREYLRGNMESSGITKIGCPLFTISLRKGAPVLEINDESKIPDEYFEPVVDLKLDKRKLLADLKEDASIPGASIVEGKSSLVIK